MTDCKQENTQRRNCTKPFSILIIGGEGVGKSSTINAISNKQLAAIGDGFSVKTTQFSAYKMDQLTIWDSPAFVQENKAEFIVFLKQHPIDHILVLTDAGSRDLGSVFSLLTGILSPYFTNEISNISIGLNNADMARSGKGWDAVHQQPTSDLTVFLNDKISSVKARILENTKMDLNVVYFCSGYNDEGDTLLPFNIDSLVNTMLPIEIKEEHWFVRIVNKIKAVFNFY